MKSDGEAQTRHEPRRDGSEKGSQATKRNEKASHGKATTRM